MGVVAPAPPALVRAFENLTVLQPCKKQEVLKPATAARIQAHPCYGTCETPSVRNWQSGSPAS